MFLIDNIRLVCGHIRPVVFSIQKLVHPIVLLIVILTDHCESSDQLFEVCIVAVILFYEIQNLL